MLQKDRWQGVQVEPSIHTHT